MTLIEEKIHELKEFSAKHFNINIDKIDGISRLRSVSDARKCVALLSREFYPEVNSAHIARLMKKQRSATRKLLRQARNLSKFNSAFNKKIMLVRNEIKKTRCHYCKTIIK